MLYLEVEGRTVDIPDDITITMNLKSPVFNDIGDYSYPFTLYATARNKSIFGFIHRVGASISTTKKFLATLRWDTKVLEYGYIIVNSTSTDGNVYECAFYPDRGYFNLMIADRKVHQFDYGTKSFDTDDDALAWINGTAYTDYPDDVACFPTYQNGAYFDPASADPDQLEINHYNASSLITKTTVNSNPMVIVPHLYMKYVLKKIFDTLNLKLTDDLFTLPDYDTLVLYNSLSCNGLCADFDYNLKEINLSLHVPQTNLNEFLSGIGNFFGAKFFADAKRNSIKLITLNDIIANPYAENISKNILTFGSSFEDPVKGYHFVNNGDGDDAIWQAKADDENEMAKQYKGAIDNVRDLPAYPLGTPGDVYFVLQSGLFYVMAANRTWTMHPNFDRLFQTQFYYKTPSVTIESALSSPYGEGALLPVVANLGTNWREITPRVMFTREANLYDPSKHVKQAALVGPTNFLRLLFYQYGDTRTDMFWTYYKNFCDATINGRTVKIIRNIDFGELRDLDMSRKYFINGYKYLIREVKVALKKNRVENAEYTLQTISQ